MFLIFQLQLKYIIILVSSIEPLLFSILLAFKTLPYIFTEPEKVYESLSTNILIYSSQLSKGRYYYPYLINEQTNKTMQINHTEKYE